MLRQLIKRYFNGHKDKRFEIIDRNKDIGPDLQGGPSLPIFIATSIKGLSNGKVELDVKNKELLIYGTERGGCITHYNGEKNIIFLRDALIEATKLMQNNIDWDSD